MNHYIVLYRIEPLMAPADPLFGFACQADSADHAEEQCLNAYPDCDVVWAAQGDSYASALTEYWDSALLAQDPSADLPPSSDEALGDALAEFAGSVIYLDLNSHVNDDDAIDAAIAALAKATKATRGAP